VGPLLPEWWDEAVDDAVAEQATHDAGVTVERLEVAKPVADPERGARDQVVQHEVVQDGDALPLLERFQDPAVGLGVVADVVERDVAARPPACRAADDLDLDPLAKRRQEQRAVVGDARALRRQRRVVGDLHPSSRSIAASHVTRSATALPARPHSCPSLGWSRR
jgi:hypothetical protein